MAGGNVNAAAPSGAQYEVLGLKQLLRVLSKLPKDLQNDVRDASQAIATDLAAGAQAAASTPLQTLAASTLKARRDRVPVVASTGTVRKGVLARDIFYGAEFGGQRRKTTLQFMPWRGNSSGAGYFLYPTARARGQRYFEMWGEALDKAFKDWDYKPPR